MGATPSEKDSADQEKNQPSLPFSYARGGTRHPKGPDNPRDLVDSAVGNKEETTITHSFNCDDAVHKFSNNKKLAPKQEWLDHPSAQKRVGAVAERIPLKNKASISVKRSSKGARKLPGVALVGPGDTGDHNPSTIPGAASNNGFDKREKLGHTKDLDNGSSALLVTARLVNVDRDEEQANLEDDSPMESKIQQEVQSRLLMQQKAVIVAEPVDASKFSMNTMGTEESETKILGLHRKVFCYMMVVVVLIVAGVVAGILATKPQGTFGALCPKFSWCGKFDRNCT